MRNYWETVEGNDDGDYPLCVAHDTFEEAEEYANANGINFINEVGGSWSEFERCWGCSEFIPAEEINEDGLCDSCVTRGHEHGF